MYDQDSYVSFGCMCFSYIQFMIEIARQKNATPLPLIPVKFGPRIPPERFIVSQLTTTRSKKGKNRCVPTYYFFLPLSCIVPRVVLLNGCS